MGADGSKTMCSGSATDACKYGVRGALCFGAPNADTLVIGNAATTNQDTLANQNASGASQLPVFLA